MINLPKPCLIHFSINKSINGLLFIGTKHFGLSLETVFSRVPKPPARIMTSVFFKIKFFIFRSPDENDKLFLTRCFQI